MIEALVVGLCSVVFSMLNRKIRTTYGLKLSFVLIFIFHAIRYDYGNDYMKYLDDYIDINQFSLFDMNYGEYYYEPAWVFLCRLFKPFGFFALVASMALFTSIVYYRFVKAYVHADYYYYSVLIYFFSPELMLIPLSAMRQSLAITIFVYSIQFVIKRNIAKYALCIAIASAFHISAIALLPVYFLAYLNWRIHLLSVVYLFALYYSFFVVPMLIYSGFNNLIGTVFEKYLRFEGTTVINTGYGLIFISFLLLIILIYERYQRQEISLLFKIAAISFFIIPASFPIPMLGRMGMYVQPVLIVVYPYVIMSMKNMLLKYSIMVSIIAFTLYKFFLFFQSDVWVNKYSTYTTVFDAPKYY